MLPREAVLRRGAAGCVVRFLLAALLAPFLALGRPARLAVAFFLEIRDRVAAAFFVDVFFFFDALAGEFFRVTFFLELCRLADVLPAVAFFLPAVFFLLAAFLPADVVFLPDAFLLLAFLRLAFLLLAFLLPALAFLLAGFFFDFAPPPVFFEDRAADRVRALFDAAFLETFFLVAAFFFGIR